MEQTPQDGAATQHASYTPSSGSSRLDERLLAWQETGDHEHLEALVKAVVPLVAPVAKSTLHRLGIDDPSAIDETVSLVLDHLRRLPGSAAGERPVKRFAEGRDEPCPCSMSDPGKAYVVWLAVERAADVGRAYRRHWRHATVFSTLDAQFNGRLHDRRRDGDADDALMHEQMALCARLHEAIPRLCPRERAVIELLLDGKSQTAIAHVLDVCEGTVSRLRVRAIASLRQLLSG